MVGLAWHPQHSRMRYRSDQAPPRQGLCPPPTLFHMAQCKNETKKWGSKGRNGGPETKIGLVTMAPTSILLHPTGCSCRHVGHPIETEGFPWRSLIVISFRLPRGWPSSQSRAYLVHWQLECSVAVGACSAALLQDGDQHLAIAIGRTCHNFQGFPISMTPKPSCFLLGPSAYASGPMHHVCVPWMQGFVSGLPGFAL